MQKTNWRMMLIRHDNGPLALRTAFDKARSDTACQFARAKRLLCPGATEDAESTTLKARCRNPLNHKQTQENMMAEPCATNDSSVSTERTAGQADRYAHGSVEWAECKLHVSRLCTAADVAETISGMRGDSVLRNRWCQIYLAAKELRACMERMESHNASMCEGTKPNA